MEHRDPNNSRPVLPDEALEKLVERYAFGISKRDVSELESQERGISPEMLDVAQEIPIGGLPGEMELPSQADQELVLDIEGFHHDVDQALDGITAGYCIAVQKPLGYRFFAFNGLARKPADGVLSWNEHIRMHVASTSKFITALALANVCERRGISLDAKVADLLPQYWDPGPNINQITFRQLLDHESGLTLGGVGEAGPVRLVDARSAVEAGVPSSPATGDYENLNFTLLRVLLPIVEGRLNREYIAAAAFDKPANDLVWDIVTRIHYSQIVNEAVFRPAGLSLSADRRSGSALAYSATDEDESGFDSGSMTALGLGAIGWQLTVFEVMKILEQLAIPGKIISRSARSDILLSFRGLPTPSSLSGEPLPVFQFSGYWQHSLSGKAEANVGFLFPGNYQVLLFVNSSSSIMSLLRNAFLHNVSVA